MEQREMKKPSYYKKVTHDMRKKENPRYVTMCFKTDAITAHRLKDEAKKKKISLSAHLYEILSK